MSWQGTVGQYGWSIELDETMTVVIDDKGGHGVTRVRCDLSEFEYPTPSLGWMLGDILYSAGSEGSDVYCNGVNIGFVTGHRLFKLRKEPV